MGPMLTVEPHPELLVGAFTTEFPQDIGALPSPAWLQGLLALEADVPYTRSGDVHGAVRALLRSTGYKPTGRGKPAAEYLVRAVEEGMLKPINLAVDACNVASLHSGLCISVIDMERAKPPYRVGVAPPGSAYVFNAGGQEIDFGGLVCLSDQDGPCANPVKDSQRTKTHAATRQTLSIVWGPKALGTRTEGVVAWYRALLERCGASTAGI